MSFCPYCGKQLPQQIEAPAACECAAGESAGAAAPMNAAPAAQLSTNRRLLKFFLLTLVTFGVYSYVFLSRVSTDINTIAGRYDGKKTMNFALLQVIFFQLIWVMERVLYPKFYYILTYNILNALVWLVLLVSAICTLCWWHKLSARIKRELTRRGLVYDFGPLEFWAFNTLGVVLIVGPFVYYYKLCRAMNLLSAHYNVNG